MIRILTGRQAAQADRRSFELGMPSPVLMERAALSVIDAMERAGYPLDSVLVAAGCGNNGGDGIAVARLLCERRYNPTVLLAGNPDHASEGYRHQLALLRQYPHHETDQVKEGRYTVLIDALFGTGLSRPVEGRCSDLIQKFNESSAKVVSIDIPSGIDADNGRVLGSAVRADLTVTFGWRKRGQIFYPGAQYCGRLVCCPIGFVPEAAKGMTPLYALEDADLKLLPARDPHGNKGTFGKVLVIAGSAQIFGAAFLAAKAALRAGAGMVMVYTDEKNRNPLAAAFPECLIRTYRSGTGEFPGLEECLDWADALVTGPGLGTDKTAESLLNRILEENMLPCILDADALNLTAQRRRDYRFRFPCTVTPHLMEMSRLTGRPVPEVAADPAGCAAEYAKAHHAVCVLKDARTVVAYPDGKVYVNLSGCSALATAGTGDVLAGILGGLTALFRAGHASLPAEAAGVFLHGKLGEAAAEKRSEGSVLASDLIEEMPRFF